jgi:uncharacterized damage-inducible protein DinB
MDRDGLLSLYRYNRYANRLVLEAASHLTESDLDHPGSPSHGSIRGLLKHMLDCEARFLAFSQGKPCSMDAGAFSTLPAITHAWDLLAHEQLGHLSSLDGSDLERMVTIHLRRQEYHFPVWQLLTQAVIHSTHHRGELSIVMTALGQPLPTLDILLQFIEESGQVW